MLLVFGTGGGGGGEGEWGWGGGVTFPVIQVSMSWRCAAVSCSVRETLSRQTWSGDGIEELSNKGRPFSEISDDATSRPQWAQRLFTGLETELGGSDPGWWDVGPSKSVLSCTKMNLSVGYRTEKEGTY